MAEITVNGQRVEWTACKKHAQYQDSGYLILSCKKCILRRCEPVSEPSGLQS